MAHTHDHELKIGSTTRQFDLVRDENGRAMYQVLEDIPHYQSALRYTQKDWAGGHGQYEFVQEDSYFEGESIDTTQPGKIFLGPEITEVQESDDTDLDSAPVAFLWCPWASPKLICATSGKIYYYGTKWTAATTTVASVTDLKFFNGKAYAARGTTPGNTYYTSTDGDTWTATDLSDDEAEKFFSAPNAAGTTNVLWKFKQPNEIYSTDNGAAGGTEWTSAAYIGDTSNNITNIFLIGNNIMVGREDNLYLYDADGGVHPLMDDFKHNRSTQNFKYVVSQWQSGTYFSLVTGLGEIFPAQQETFDLVGPLSKIDDIGKTGVIVGLTSETEYLYVAIDEGTNTIIYKGKEVYKNGTLKWTWCPWVFVGTETMATMLVVQHTSTDRRLWFGYTNSTAYVKITDNPLADSAARFCTAGWCRMSYLYGSDPYFDKLWQSAVIEQHRVNSGAITTASAGETVQLKYRDDTDTAATSIISAYNTAGVVETNFSAALNNKRIQFELHLASDTNTATSVVTYFQAKGVENPTTVRIHEAYYRIGDTPSNRSSTLRTFLRGGRTSTSLLKFADLRYGQKTSGTASGDYVWCVMMPGYPKEVEVFHGKQKQPEIAIQVRLQEVSFTIS